MTLYRAPDSRHARRPVHRSRRYARMTTAVSSSSTGRSSSEAPSRELRARHPAETVVDLTDGVLLPGFVDTHVHYPQIRAIGALGMPLLDWLEQCALPEEARLADVDYARAVAREFVGCPDRSRHDDGTGLRVTFRHRCRRAVRSGGGRRAPYHQRPGRERPTAAPRPAHPPDHAYDEGRSSRGTVARRRPRPVRGHPRGSRCHAPTTCSTPCASLHRDIEGSWVTSHINENLAEIVAVRELCRRRQLPRQLRPARLVDPPQRARAQRAPHRMASSSGWPQPARRSRTARRATPR